MRSKYYTVEEIAEKFEKLSWKKKAHVLFSALDYMQQYNGRTRPQCIAMAMGYQNDSGNQNEYYKDEHH